MSDKIYYIDKILKAEDIEYWGYCTFPQIDNDLLICRAKEKLPENPQNIICMLFPYQISVEQRNISYYAVPKDYHKIVLPKLKRMCINLKEIFTKFSFSAFVDNSPVKEVKTAVKCSIGVKGDNGLLINEKYGSFVFIGEIVTNMPLPKNSKKIQKASCLHCGACEKECPGSAIKNGKIDKNLCVSAISQKKGLLSKDEINILKKTHLVWGCDICQEVCPMNKNVSFTNMEEFKKDIIPIIKLGDYKNLNDRAFQWRKADVIERNIQISSEENEA